MVMTLGGGSNSDGGSCDEVMVALIMLMVVPAMVMAVESP